MPSCANALKACPIALSHVRIAPSSGGTIAQSRCEAGRFGTGTAAAWNVPIYTSSPGDSSIGMNIAAMPGRQYAYT